MFTSALDARKAIRRGERHEQREEAGKLDAFNYGADLAPLMREVQRVLVQEPGYTGMGGHGLQSHHGHGEHRQVNIGLDGRTITFRESSGQ